MDLNFLITHLLVCVVCLIFGIIIIPKLTINIGSEHEVKTLKAFLICYLVFVATNAAQIWCEYEYLPAVLNVPLNAVNMPALAFNGYFWLKYTELRLKPELWESKLYRRILIFPAVLIILLEICSVYTGWVFSYKDGAFVEGPLFFAAILVGFVYLAASFLHSVFSFFTARSREQKREAFLMTCIMLGPMCVGAIEIVIPGLPAIELVILVAFFAIFVHLREKQIYTDALTGLNNRKLAEKYVNRRIYSAMNGAPFYLFMVDANGFKSINDKFGHLEGDRALKIIGASLREIAARYNSFVSRYGGDEFLVTAELANIGSPAEFISKINETLVGKAKECGLPYELSLSIGYAECSADNARVSDLIKEADAMMYNIKRLSQAEAQAKSDDEAQDEEGASLAKLANTDVFRIRKEERDSLTGLPNMAFFFRYADKIIKSRKQAGKGDCVIIYFNIMRLKVYNLEYGFYKGNTLLKYFASLLKSTFEGELLSRFADDHYVVLTLAKDIEKKIEAVHKKMHEYNKYIPVQIKAGICFCDKNTDIAGICDLARIACISIKDHYTVFYRFYDEKLQKEEQERQYIITRFEEAMEKGWISIHYQPVVRLVTGKIYSLEALARWEDPSREQMIYPSSFISILKSHNVIHLLDLYIIRQVCKDYTYFKQKGIPMVPVSVNLSPMDFELCNIFEEIRNILRDYLIPENWLHIEITESTFSPNHSLIKKGIDDFHSISSQVWLDDFGGDHSSLNVMTNYDFDVIKFDRDVMWKLKYDKHSKIMITSLTSLAKELGIRILVEGIESKYQVEALKRIGCELGQGYYFYRPMSAEDILNIAKNNRDSVEDSRSCDYYNTIGALDLVHAANIKLDKELAAITQRIPMAVAELDGDYINYIVANDAYYSLMNTLGISSPTKIEKHANDLTGIFDISPFELAEKAVRTRKWESMNLIIGGEYYTAWVHYIDTDPYRHAHALVHVLINLNSYTQDDKLNKANDALFSLYSLYLRVDMFDVENKTVENLYKNVLDDSAENQPATGSDLIKWAADKLIFPDDLDRFLAFYDYHTIAERIAASSSKSLTAFFRAKFPDGNYHWRSYTLLPFSRKGRQYILNCICNIDEDVNGDILGLPRF